MKVSVIITTYKRSRFLVEAIKSVLNQSFKDFELIIVDDDPDGKEAEKIALSYNDSRIVYFKNKENLGGTKSLNIGLRLAKGEYIAILDDDDVWLSRDKLEKQVYFLDNNPGYVIVGTNSLTVEGDTEREISGPIKDWPKTKDAKRMLFSKLFFPHSSVLYRKREALLAGGYSEQLIRAKDLDFYFKISKFGKIGFLSECLVKHREVLKEERDIVETRYIDSVFQRKVFWKHRIKKAHFWISFLRINLRCLLFFLFRIFPTPYYIYRECRYGKFFEGLKFKLL